MIGTSGALRILYETERPQPRDGLFMYRVDGRRVCEGGALSDGGNLHAWLERTLVEPGKARDDHGLTFLPFLGGERSTGWDPHQTGALLGLTFDTTPADIRRAALEGVGFRFAAIADLVPEVDEIVATGGALLKDREWVQLLADTLARPVTLSGVDEASLRGAAVAVLQQPADAPLGDTFHPREERAEAYRWARERQDRLYEVLRGEI
jgi:gluconokinase